MLWVNFLPSPSSFQIYFQQKTHVTGVYMVDTLTVFWDVASCVTLYYIIRSNLEDHYFNDIVRLFLTENQVQINTAFSNTEWCLQWQNRSPTDPQAGGRVSGVFQTYEYQNFGGVISGRILLSWKKAVFCVPDMKSGSIFANKYRWTPAGYFLHN